MRMMISINHLPKNSTNLEYSSKPQLQLIPWKQIQLFWSNLLPPSETTMINSKMMKKKGKLSLSRRKQFYWRKMSFKKVNLEGSSELNQKNWERSRPTRKMKKYQCHSKFTRSSFWRIMDGRGLCVRLLRWWVSRLRWLWTTCWLAIGPTMTISNQSFGSTAP